MMRCDDINVNGTPKKAKFHRTFYRKQRRPNRTKLHNKTMFEYFSLFSHP